MEYSGAEVDPVGDERGERLVAEYPEVGLLGHVLVERRPLAGDRAQLARRNGAELRRFTVDLRILHLTEVLVVGRLDRCALQQQIEVDRVREVLVPVGEAGLGVELQVPDRGEVRRIRDHLLGGLEPDRVQERGVVGGPLLARRTRLAPDRDRGPGHSRLLDQGLRLGQIAAAGRVPVWARGPGGMANHARRQEEARRD